MRVKGDGIEERNRLETNRVVSSLVLKTPTVCFFILDGRLLVPGIGSCCLSRKGVLRRERGMKESQLHLRIPANFYILFPPRFHKLLVLYCIACTVYEEVSNKQMGGQRAGDGSCHHLGRLLLDQTLYI